MRLGATKASYRSTLARELAIVAAFTLLTLVATYPLVLRLATHTPGDGVDDHVFQWNDGYAARLLRGDEPFLATKGLFHPGGVSLLLHTHTLPNGIAAALLAPLLGRTAAHDVVLLATFVLSGWGATLFVRSATRASVEVAFVAGLVFAFLPYRFAHLLGHGNLVSTHPLPFFAWALASGLAKDDRRGQLRWGALAATFFGLQIWSDYALGLFGALFATVLVVAALAQRRRVRTIDGLRGPFLLALVLGSAVWVAPLAVCAIRDAAAGVRPTMQNIGSERFYGDLRAYVRPSYLHPWLGAFAHSRELEQVVTLGYVASLLVLAGAFLEVRARRFALVVAALLFFALSLGPEVRWNGESLGPRTPYAILQRTPVLASLRAPGRFVVGVALAGTALAAVALVAITARLPNARGRRLLLATVGGLVFFEGLAIPFPTAEAVRSSVLERLRADEAGSRGAVLEVPLLLRDGYTVVGVEDHRLHSAQVIHERPRLGGMVARLDPSVVARQRSLPFVDVLLAAQTFGPVGFDDAARARACDLVRVAGISSVLVAPSFRGSRAHMLVTASLPTRLLGDDGLWVAYAIDADACARFPLVPLHHGVDAAFVSLGAGFSTPERPVPGGEAFVWGGPDAELTLSAPRMSHVDLGGRLIPEVVGRARVRVYDGDRLVGESAPGAERAWYPVDLDPPRDHVTFRIATSGSFQPPGDGRTLSFALEQVWVRAAP